MARLIWSVDSNNVFAHLEDVGAQQEFRSVLTQLKSDVHNLRWSQQRNAWQVPLANFPQLVRFADNHDIKIVWSGQVTVPRQMSLFE
ncbi:MAG: hypothetical protein SF123_24855 [Chloroflexota bacterium]|nr:hypothetical protein [Chloroflexota bacterium]